MAELDSANQRAVFPKKQQLLFLNKAQNQLGIAWGDLATRLGTVQRNLFDWRREKISMPLAAVELICDLLDWPRPKNIKIRDAFWSTKKAAHLGGVATLQKYGRVGGDSTHRTEQWQKWWQTTGKFRRQLIIGRTIPIRKPRPSVALAEWVGIVLGDGGISPYQIIITLNHKDDREYVQYVAQLTKKLFGVAPKLNHRAKYSVINIVISRKQLVEVCVGQLGLVLGNKIRQNIDIPDWIQARPQYLVACVRGLIDTDGCIFIHRYQVRGKWYQYKKLTFTSYSLPLRRSVSAALQAYGLRPRINDRDVRLDSKHDVRQYFRIFGSHNPKHLKKYRK